MRQGQRQQAQQLLLLAWVQVPLLASALVQAELPARSVERWRQGGASLPLRPQR